VWDEVHTSRKKLAFQRKGEWRVGRAKTKIEQSVSVKLKEWLWLVASFA
jgi:hypothetical protein